MTELFEGGEEDRAGVVVVQVGTTAIATEGDKVVVAGALVAFESGGHGQMIVVLEAVGCCGPLAVSASHPCAMRMDGAPTVLVGLGVWVGHPPWMGHHCVGGIRSLGGPPAGKQEAAQQYLSRKVR